MLLEHFEDGFVLFEPITLGRVKWYRQSVLEFAEGRLARGPVFLAGFAFTGENRCCELVHRGNLGINQISDLEIRPVSLCRSIELN